MDASRVQELMFQTVLHDVKWGDTELDTFDMWGDIKGSVAVNGLGNVSIAESFGGEGQGDQYYLVFEVDLFDDRNEIGLAGTRYYRVDGYWASYDGGEYDGPFYEVQPVEKMVTFYEKVD